VEASDSGSGKCRRIKRDEDGGGSRRKEAVCVGGTQTGEEKEEAPLRQREEDIRIRQRRGWEWPADAVSGGGGGGRACVLLLLLLVDACER